MTNTNHIPPKVIVGFSAYPWDHALTLLRLVEPIRQAGLQFLKGNDYERVFLDQISLADLVVIQRDFPRWKDSYLRVLDRARSEGKPVVYESDDLLLELPEDHPDRPIHYYTQALFPMLRAVVEADALTATTPALCAYLRPFNENIFLLPNYLVDRFWPLKQTPERRNSPTVVIGYMGSNTHAADLEMITPVLVELLELYGEGIILRFWGGEPPEKLRNDSRVEWDPFQTTDYEAFADHFSKQQCEIFIAPLQDSLFNRCKSPIKYLEYSSMAIPGVYSRVAPYESIIREGENGFLAGSQEEWRDCLVRLIESPETRLKMGTLAAKTVSDSWLLSKNAHQWQEVYTKVFNIVQVGGSRDLPQMGTILRIANQVQAWQESLETQVREQKEQIESLDRQNSIKEQEIQKLHLELSNLYSSNGWVYLQRLMRFRRWLIPEGSQREVLFKKILGGSGPEG
jgi:glycosyltransferase involved in cell wall biosynthesis